MRFFQLTGGLKPLEACPPQPWQKVLALAGPEELPSPLLPKELAPAPGDAPRHESQGCRLSVENGRICGGLHLPARKERGAVRLAVYWARDNLLIVDYTGGMEACLAGMAGMRPHHADGADDFLTDLLLQLIAGDLEFVQELETRVSNLEQAVLDNETGRFISQMSAVRRELNRSNRLYAQLGDFASSLQENAADLLDENSQRRLGYFLRRVNGLREETQMLREYASQVSSEYQAQVDIAQNRIMKLLTIVTTIFLPLSLIVGWYGMNFVHMPELQWAYGYPLVIVVSVAVVAGCVLFFKKRHYW